MRAASAGRRALVVGALGLRLWGIDHGLPYVFNADENAHFVPRAIGMFGHSLNPEYFINPPGFTYLLHVAFWVRWGGREAVGDAFAADPGSVFALARVLAARARRGGRRVPRLGRAAAVRPARRRSSPARCWRSPSCPSTTRTWRSTTCPRWRRCA